MRKRRGSPSVTTSTWAWTTTAAEQPPNDDRDPAEAGVEPRWDRRPRGLDASKPGSRASTSSAATRSHGRTLLREPAVNPSRNPRLADGAGANRRKPASTMAKMADITEKSRVRMRLTGSPESVTEFLNLVSNNKEYFFWTRWSKISNEVAKGPDRDQIYTAIPVGDDPVADGDVPADDDPPVAPPAEGDRCCPGGYRGDRPGDDRRLPNPRHRARRVRMSSSTSSASATRQPLRKKRKSELIEATPLRLTLP